MSKCLVTGLFMEPDEEMSLLFGFVFRFLPCCVHFIRKKKWFQESSRPETTATSETKVMSMWLIDADLVTGVNEGVGIPEPNEMGLYWKDAGSFFSFYYFLHKATIPRA